MQNTLCYFLSVLEFVTRTFCHSPETVQSNFEPNARIPHVTLLAASQFSFNINHMPAESICWPLLIRTRATQCPRSKGDSPICALLIDGHALHFIYFKARNQPSSGRCTRQSALYSSNRVWGCSGTAGSSWMQRRRERRGRRSAVLTYLRSRPWVAPAATVPLHSPSDWLTESRPPAPECPPAEFVLVPRACKFVQITCAEKLACLRFKRTARWWHDLCSGFWICANWR